MIITFSKSLALAALLGGLLAPASAQVARRPADPPPQVGFERAAQWVDEGDAVLVVVELSAPSERPVAVPFRSSGSARVGHDLTIDPSPLVIRAGDTRGEILVTIHDDDLDESVETLAITLGDPKGASLLGDQVHTLGIGGPALGGPIPGLTPDELSAFRRGLKVFERRFTPEEGLGPFYNATSCASCHSSPVTGGTSSLYRNFYLGVYQFGSTPASQSSAIPPFLSQIVPAFGSGLDHASADFTLEGGRPLIPDDVFGFPVISAQRNAIPVFGTGLFEFISDQTILEKYDPFDLDEDGITGQINLQLNGTAIGRFGLKAQVNNIELFTRGPLQNQMGVTTDPFLGSDGIISMSPLQVGADPNDPTVDDDGVPDPELPTSDLADLIAFTRFLAPPAKVPFSAAATQGEALFEQVGCTGCHLPSMPSSRGPVDAYTDLLMHDMGEELVDGILLGDVSTSWAEYRTQPLWGVSLMAPFLHDGRAATLHDAIDAHGGEGLASRDLYLALTPAEQEDLITFLEHL
jgi:hypothetical protein